VALVGSPNSGKTTLFNALTGARQKTGNYAGVTVEKKEGLLALGPGLSVGLLDLPGAYSLDARTPDEAVTADLLRGARADEPRPRAIIAVADATNLERNLYLVLQLQELGLPMVLALTMADLARKQGIEVERDELSRRLGMPVVLTSARRKEGLADLLEQVGGLLESSASAPHEAGRGAIDNSPQKIIHRYKTIEHALRAALRKNEKAKDVTRAIDKVVLHRVWGPLILVVSFALMFQMIFSLAEYPMDALQHAVDALEALGRTLLPAGDLTSLIIDGVLAGVGAVVVFIPQILLLFAFIILFEDSGYMARAAFVLDRLMTKVGLNGRAFIPLLSAFACAVPGIMATRTIENRRDRLVTILVAPLMTCSARIPIYAMLIAAFIPATRVLGVFTYQGLTMVGMYLFGVVSALIVAAVLKRTALRGEVSTFIMEMPTYKVPSLKNLAMGLWDRARIFLRKAGTIILAVSVVLWALATYPKATPPAGMTEPKAVAAYQLAHSFAGQAGHAMEPFIEPLGYNWKIGVALLSSFAAREVVLSTLGTVYAIGYSDGDSAGLGDTLRKSPDFSLATALSLLVFYALACQCMSTLAITRRETNSWRWPAVMFTYMTALAYGAAFVTFHLARLL